MGAELLYRREPFLVNDGVADAQCWALDRSWCSVLTKIRKCSGDKCEPHSETRLVELDVCSFYRSEVYDAANNATDVRRCNNKKIGYSCRYAGFVDLFGNSGGGVGLKCTYLKS